ncbi:hypothetical protein QE152_g24811 [Popillia japonica]|uniref:Uncharacterized protein n=1 Tax=Popillia japonica TaxID=7064 RepID=A0AAW1K3C4_POPJA
MGHIAQKCTEFADQRETTIIETVTQENPTKSLDNESLALSPVVNLEAGRTELVLSETSGQLHSTEHSHEWTQTKPQKKFPSVKTTTPNLSTKRQAPSTTDSESNIVDEDYYS